MIRIIERLESEVRSYCRSFPVVFERAEGSVIYDQKGQRYLDFFAGAGALNYGHNDPFMRERLIDYLGRCGITHGLDMATEAKCEFLDIFERTILIPNDLQYKVMFPGPTGTNAVEAALKLARKITGRTEVIAFTNAFHGMTLGSLALTGNAAKRNGSGVTLDNVTRMPFDGYLGDDVNTLDYIEAFLSDPSSGIDAPAAFIVETIQGEGGINVASAAWLQGLQKLARRHDALLIVDDIQVGCGRTGSFFSFEQFGLHPDVICLSKSLSGFGLPFALTLFRPELDQWEPGEHNGTFRGNNLAFVTATTTLERYWQDKKLREDIVKKSRQVNDRLSNLADCSEATVRGRGLIQGLAFDNPTVATSAAREAFNRGLIIETAGARDEVLKLLPPLTINPALLQEGLDIIEASVTAAQESIESPMPHWNGTSRASLGNEAYS